MSRHWSSFFDLDALRRHDDWLKRGRAGEGRLAVLGADLRELKGTGARLEGVRLVKCSLDGAHLSYSILEDAELVECTGAGAVFQSTTFDRSEIRDCTFTNADFRLVHFIGARISGGGFAHAALDRATFFDAVVENVDFHHAWFVDAKLDRARFIACNMRDTNFSRVDDLLKKLSSTVETRFERCDLRGAKFGGRKLDRTVFDRCKVHGVSGKPEMLGPITVIEPDFSPEGDGSDIRDADALLAALV